MYAKNESIHYLCSEKAEIRKKVAATTLQQLLVVSR